MFKTLFKIEKNRNAYVLAEFLFRGFKHYPDLFRKSEILPKKGAKRAKSLLQNMTTQIQNFSHKKYYIIYMRTSKTAKHFFSSFVYKVKV